MTDEVVNEVAVARAKGPGRRWVLARAPGAGATVVSSPDLPDVVAELERLASPRWIWERTAGVYGELLAAGVRVARCRDVAMTETLLLSHKDDFGRSPAVAAAWARLKGLPEPAPASADPAPGRQETLFAPDDEGHPLAGGTPELEALLAVHAAQAPRIAAAREVSPGFGLLVAADSAVALVAAEMGHTGMPWRADVHDAVLEEALGPRPRRGTRPERLQALAEQVASALGSPGLNPDSPVAVVRAFVRAGVPLQTTRAHELKRIDHPAVAPLLLYKEASRLHVAHGWAWRETWVRDGRLRPSYVPAGVVTGRWATRGGAALQIPKVVRSAVVADPGWVLVMADAGQVEPRLLAALSGDPGMIAATARGDLYAALAEQALGGAGARAEAKLALLSAMYGGGAGSQSVAALRTRFPRAFAFVEDAARTGEGGGFVRSVLGRTSPSAPPGWPGDDAEAVQARGRFTRNFVVQASAADWANVLLAELRRRLVTLPGGPEIVFFQHDEVIVHSPESLAPAVVAAVSDAGREATRLVLGDRGVHIPLDAVVAPTYGAKP